MIIVDEENDQSFKQDEGITYNARDMAISRLYLDGPKDKIFYIFFIKK